MITISHKSRLIIYGCGFFLGCILMQFAMSTKTKIKHDREQEMGYKPRGAIGLPGEVVTARLPLDKSLAIFTKDYERSETGEFLRVLIAEGPESYPYVRIEEILNASTGKEVLKTRRMMAADKIAIRLSPGANYADFENLIASLKGHILNEKRCDLYVVQCNTYGPDTLPWLIQKIAEQENIVERAVPLYLSYSEISN